MSLVDSPEAAQPLIWRLAACGINEDPDGAWAVLDGLSADELRMVTIAMGVAVASVLKTGMGMAGEPDPAGAARVWLRGQLLESAAGETGGVS